MDLFDDPDQYEDIDAPVGCDLKWGFDIEPWDGSGTSAAFILGGTSYAMVVQIVGESTRFFVHLTPTQLMAHGLNVAGTVVNYVVRETMTDTSLLQIGHGTVLAQ